MNLKRQLIIRVSILTGGQKNPCKGSRWCCPSLEKVKVCKRTRERALHFYWPTLFLRWGWMRRRKKREEREKGKSDKRERDEKECERTRDHRWERTRGHVERGWGVWEEESKLWGERERASVGGLGFAQRPWLLSSSSSSSLLHTFAPSLSFLFNLISSTSLISLPGFPQQPSHWIKNPNQCSF